ncbi:hypothetical protein Scep_010713 [Stephania cephalantha]|uniref:Uncharacterized protein n=1 Tax=Stephania cephalantha TaxID=152367 RepID=A0AAP0JY13_9MAGN
MPSAQDQLSKLAGTTFICICMGFFMPSLGLTTDSECLSNMISLTIFVVTVLVNICIQMHTGVITSFKAEHIVILCCMMLLLMMLWHYAPMLSAQKQVFADFTKARFANGDGSLLERLKLCYLCTFQSNPQFMFCRKLMCPSTSMLCAICSAVLLQAVFRSFASKELLFCEGISDYRWSMWAIVVSQTIAVLVGFLSTIIRLVTVADHVQSEDIWRDACVCCLADDITWYGNSFTRIIMCPVGIIVNLINILAMAPYSLFGTLKRHFRVARHGACSNICKPKDEGGMKENSEGYKVLTYDGGIWMQYLDDWTIRKGVKDMKRWIEMSKAKFLNHVIEFLCKTPPSQEPLTILLENQNDVKRQDYKISSLSIVVLVKVAALFIPSSLSRSMFDSLGEIFEFIRYIDRKMSFSSFKNKKKYMDSKYLWTSSAEFDFFFRKPDAEVFQSEMQLDQAIETIERVKEDLRYAHRFIAEEVDMILGLVRRKAYTSLEELHRGMEQLYVDMLNEQLSQLPDIILKEINESSAEDLEERVKHALQVVSTIQQLDGLVRWSFPLGTTITNLVEVAAMVDMNRGAPETNSNAIASNENTLVDPNAEKQCHTPFEGSSNILQLTVDEDPSLIVSKAIQDEIVQIE